MCVNVTIVHNNRMSEDISKRFNVTAVFSDVPLSLSGMNDSLSTLVHIMDIDEGTFKGNYINCFCDFFFFLFFFSFFWLGKRMRVSINETFLSENISVSQCIQVL